MNDRRIEIQELVGGTITDIHITGGDLYISVMKDKPITYIKSASKEAFTPGYHISDLVGKTIRCIDTFAFDGFREINIRTDDEKSYYISWVIESVF